MLEKLRSTDVREDILQMFYTATVSSISTFGMIRWGEMHPNKTSTDSTREARWVGGEKARKYRHSLSSISDKQTILADETTPLRPEFVNRHIDRSDRFRSPCR